MRDKLLPVIIIIIAIALITGGFVYFRQNKNATKSRLFEGPITIGTETWPGYVALYVAESQGFFRDQGLNVDVKLYKDLSQLSGDYQAGKMQGRANISLEAVNESLDGFKQNIVLAIDYSAGADAIVASKKIVALTDLSGKLVAFEKGTLEEFFISWALQQADLTLSDITAVEANPDEAAQMLKRGEVDVAVSHEPFLSELASDPDLHILTSSKDAPGLITDILTFRQDFVENNPQTVQAIVTAYFQALNFVKNNPDQAAVILAKEFKISASDIERQLQGLKLLDLTDNATIFAPGNDPQSLYLQLDKIGRFVAEERNKVEVINTDTMVDPTFINYLVDQNNPGVVTP
ncbi:MAG: hypothetical protein C3F02_00770 [Parcubacteria group bacterium]|nr:MAG: hypothetical protein C3F02_00770 [Parcubacteria group bacterium]